MRPEDVDHTWPEIPEWVDIHDLGADVRADLRGLSKQGAEFVAGHLAAAGELAEVDPEQAWEHARAARSQGGRVSVVRETVGLVAYRAGKWSEAIAELRAARRMAGGPGQLAVMADSERALGNPERAIDLSKSPEAAQLDAEASAELAIVAAGARSDLGQHEAALAALHAAARTVDPAAGFAYRVYYAYAAKLAELGRTAEALTWFVRAADADAEDDSDAAERADALAGGESGTHLADDSGVRSGEGQGDIPGTKPDGRHDGSGSGYDEAFGAEPDQGSRGNHDDGPRARSRDIRGEEPDGRDDGSDDHDTDPGDGPDDERDGESHGTAS